MTHLDHIKAALDAQTVERNEDGSLSVVWGEVRQGTKAGCPQEMELFLLKVWRKNWLRTELEILEKQ